MYTGEIHIYRYVFVLLNIYIEETSPRAFSFYFMFDIETRAYLLALSHLICIIEYLI